MIIAAGATVVVSGRAERETAAAGTEAKCGIQPGPDEVGAPPRPPTGMVTPGMANVPAADTPEIEIVVVAAAGWASGPGVLGGCGGGCGGAGMLEFADHRLAVSIGMETDRDAGRMADAVAAHALGSGALAAGSRRGRAACCC